MNDEFAMRVLPHDDLNEIKDACDVLASAQSFETSASGMEYNTHGLQANTLSSELMEHNGMCIVADASGVIVGTLSLMDDAKQRWYKKDAGHYQTIKYVGVAPEWQGHGIAHRLVEFAINKSDGVVTASTDERNVKAVRLYESCGFRVMEYARPRGAESNAVILAFWKNGCPPATFEINLHRIASKTKCLTKRILKI